MNLDHCELQISLEVEEISKAIRDSANEEIYLAVSKDFYEVDDQENYEGIYDSYQRYFYSAQDLIDSILKEVSTRIDWDDERYPEYAVGECIAIWEQSNKWLRIHHEDKELPIMIVLEGIPQ